MLEFSSFFDAHFHLFSPKFGENQVNLPQNGRVCCSGISCAVSKQDFMNQEKYLADHSLEKTLKLSFGIHPWYLNLEDADFLEELLKSGRIAAAGEAGFDLYTQELKERAEQQEKAWDIQLSLAEQYGFPLVIHCRKALPRILADSGRLRRIPAVLFHGFSGSREQMEETLRKIPGAFFGFGSLVLKESGRAVECLRDVPGENFLLETDEAGSDLLGEIYRRAGEIRGTEVENIIESVNSNCKVFKL